MSNIPVIIVVAVVVVLALFAGYTFGHSVGYQKGYNCGSYDTADYISQEMNDRVPFLDPYEEGEEERPGHCEEDHVENQLG